MNRLKELRSEKGVSQKEVALHIEKTPQAYSLYEKSLRDPDSDTLIKLADYFGVTTDYLLGQDDSRSASMDEENKKPADLKKILENQQVMFDGEIVTEDDKELVKRMLEKMYWTAKEKNKRKK